MRKLVGTLILVLVLSGCSLAFMQSQNVPSQPKKQQVEVNDLIQTWDREGIKFIFPKEMTISADPASNSNIVVEKIPFTKFIHSCDVGEVDMQERDEEIKTTIENGLKLLKEKGFNENLYNVDNMGCGWVQGNLNVEIFKIDDLNGAIFDKGLYQDVGELGSFKTQFLIMNWYDEVYTITFNYNFGDIARLFKELKKINSEHNLPETNMTEDDWQEVNDFFEKKIPIKSKSLKGFEENREIIEGIIKTIQLKKSY